MVDNYINLEELTTTTLALLYKINEQSNLKVNKNSVTATLSEGTKIGSVNGTDFYTPTVPNMLDYVTWYEYENRPLPYIVLTDSTPNWDAIQAAISNNQPIVGAFLYDELYISCPLYSVDLDAHEISFVYIDVLSITDQNIHKLTYANNAWTETVSLSRLNTVGSTNNINKLYLVGTTTQSNASLSFSNSNLFFNKGLYSKASYSDNDSYISLTENSIRLEVLDENYNDIAAYIHEGVFSIASGTSTASLAKALFQADKENDQVIIRKLVNPTTATDAANKAYVDSTISTAITSTYSATSTNAMNGIAVNSAITSAIGNINSFDVEVVNSLPSSNIKTHTIYFVSSTSATNNIYDEYMYINSAWEKIGNTAVDLTGYVLESQLAAVAATGSYNSLTDKPTIPTVTSTYSATGTDAVNGTAVASAISGITYPVTSVNGATGTVVLTASDVGAASSSHSHTSIFTSGGGGIYNSTISVDSNLSRVYHTDTYGGSEIIAKTNQITLATTTGNQSKTLTISGGQISGLETPTSNTMAANKAYVDSAVAAIVHPVTSVNGQTGAVTISLVQSDWNATTGTAAILNKPSIPAAVSVSNTLSSGTLIATINGTNIYAPSYVDADGVSY